jgi:protein-tyrosine kinase
MSIVERAANLLGSVPQTHEKPSTPGQEVRVRDLDPIARAVSELTENFRSVEPREFAAQPVAKSHTAEGKVDFRPASAARRTARALKVNIEWLRQHGMITPGGERTPTAESFRRIKRQILANVARSKSGAPANLVLVTSAVPGEGKTYCAINLAISIALEMDRTVLLVDADVARPSVPQALGVKVERGLLDVLRDRQIELADVLCNTDIGKLTLLPAGTAHQHATELLASETMGGLLQEMAGRYPDRIIIFDSPPLLAASEAAVLASRMGQIVMVVEAGKTSGAVLKAALGRIDSSNVAGLLLNKGQGSRRGYDFGYYG